MALSEEKEYLSLYGHLPDTQEELVKLFESTKKINWDKVHDIENHINNIAWETIQIVLPVVPKATPRPRYSPVTKNVYVKGAQKTKKMIKKRLAFLNLICTRVEFDLEVYIKTPSGMTLSEAYLAEKGLILPISKPDFDNVAKTYSDALQDVLLLNDNIINPGSIKKFYSIKPRVIINIRYQTDFDSEFNKRKILDTKAFQDRINLRSVHDAK